MNYNIFIKVFFEKSKYLIMYSLSIITFWYVLFFQVASVAEKVHYEEKMPDVEIYGQMAEENDSYMLYQTLNTGIQSSLMKEGVIAYGLTARNLFTFSDANYSVSYRLYGAEDEYINGLAGYLRSGRLPKAGEKEALIGNNAAKFYGIQAGDVLDVPVTLEAHGDAAFGEYVVSGILTGEAAFFGDSILISKDTCDALGYPAEDNMLYLYAPNEQAYQNMIRRLEEWEATGDLGEVILHSEHKASLSDTIRDALLKTIPFSAIVLTVLFVSLMKYSGRKIGVMKALGISEKYIMRLLAKGFGVYNLLGMLLSYFSLAFVRMGMGFSLPVSVMLYSVYSFAIIFLVTMVILFVLCKRISPRLAMYPY